MRKHIFYLTVLLGLLSILVGPVHAQQQLPPEVVAYADIILYNGTILTADDSFTMAQGVAIRENKFLAVGNSDRILRMAGPGTRKIDLKGQTAVPGFIESHSHGWTGNTATSAPRTPGQARPGYEPAFVGKTVDEYLMKVKAAVDKYPAGMWLNLSTIRNEISINQLNRWELDKVSPSNPVKLQSSPSEAVVNSLALEEVFKSGVITPDTIGVQKDEQGRPNGQLWGLAQGELNLSFMPWPEEWDTEWVERQKVQLQRNVQNGVTTRIGRAQGLAISILNELHQAGELPLRVRVSHEFFRKNAKYLVDLRRFGNMSGVGDDWLKIVGTTPQQVDGGSAIGAIFTTRPKIRRMENEAYGPYGKNYWATYPEGYVEQTLIDANRHGWNIVSLHNYGDRSTNLVTKAFEAAANDKPFKRRWVIDHNWSLTPEGIERMKKLNIVPSVLLWFDLGETGEMSAGGRRVAESFGGVVEPMIYMYGPDRLMGWSPAKSLIAAGLKPIAETAGPPLESIEGFITRKDSQGRVWEASERVSRREALWMKTNWAARYTMEEDKLGTIEPGKLADVVVLGGDYMSVPEDEISEIPILMTIVGGKVMHEVAGEF